MEKETFQKFGFALIVTGIIGLIVSVFLSGRFLQDLGGAPPAISFLVLMVGFAFCFPSMLEESQGQLSTMRIVVFSVTMVFCLIYIKLAWNISAIESMRIDAKWIYILGLAFGSKAFQRYGENDSADDQAEEEKKGSAAPGKK